MAEAVWRSAVRRLLPGPIFRALARLPRDPMAYIRRFGPRPGTALYLGMIGFPGHLVEVAIPGVRTQVLLRAGTSDVPIFEQIFVHGQYDVSLGFEPRSILDAGANIGLAAVFFANRYRDARILAVEPDRRNFELLVQNTRDYPKIKAIHAGLWSRRVPLRIVNPGDEPWAFRLEEGRDGESIAAITVEAAMEALDAGRIDLLKLDIEGSELDVMRHSQAWIERIGAIVAELHGPACEDAFLRAVTDRGFQCCHPGGEVILARREAPTMPPASPSY
jgi:FkbM family methyltransferase